MEILTDHTNCVYGSSTACCCLNCLSVLIELLAPNLYNFRFVPGINSANLSFGSLETANDSRGSNERQAGQPTRCLLTSN